MAQVYQSIEGWFDFDDIYELALRRCGSKPACFVEVGAYKGRSTCYMAERLRESGLDAVRFDVVDTFGGDDDVGHGDLWPQFAANLERGGLLSRLTPHRRPSSEAADAFADRSLDFVFIDARHTFEAVREDLVAWWAKLRPGGLIAGHDYDNAPGVKAAVDGFVAAQGLGHAFRTTRSSWMIYRSLAIDAAYCINLGHRSDRRRKAEAQFEAAGLAAVTFFDAADGGRINHPGTLSDGQAGCTKSHLDVLRAAREQGHGHVLIFEDDIELADDFRPRFDAALARCPASYDLCYVGAICERGWGNYLYPFDDMLSRVGSVCGTHAYIVNMACHDVIQSGLGDLRAVIDDWYARTIQPRGDCYGFAPWLGFQGSGWSDVAQAFNANGSHAGYVWR